jgi:Protein of unknown function (DUF1353)
VTGCICAAAAALIPGMAVIEAAPGTERGARALGFDPAFPLDVRATGDETWQVLGTLVYRASDEDFIVSAGEGTDFASVPRAFVWLLPRYGRYTKAAILHDHLWRVEVPAGRIKRIDADGIFRQAMRTLGVPFLRRWIMWAAVRWAALTQPDGRHGWWREAWRVLLVTLVALPIVLPAGLLVFVTIHVFYGVEWLVMLPLQAARWRRRRSGLPVKRVNRPRLSWRL